MSQRKIAHTTGVSRATIQAIASGKRPDYPPRETDADYPSFSGAPQRCPGCGGLVFLPCHLCRIRRYRSQLCRQVTKATSSDASRERRVPPFEPRRAG